MNENMLAAMAMLDKEGNKGKKSKKGKKGDKGKNSKSTSEIKIKKRNKGAGKIDPKKTITKKAIKVEPPKEGIPEDMITGKLKGALS